MAATKRRKKEPAPPALPRDRWFPGRVLAIDPSSTAVGAVILDGGDVAHLSDFFNRKDGPVARADWLAGKVAEFALRHEPEVAVMESVMGRAYRGRGIKSLMSLVHAQATIRARLRGIGLEVHCVSVNDWAGDRDDKAARARNLAAGHPRYAAVAHLDPGYDLADAIGVGLWWISRNEE